MWIRMVIQWLGTWIRGPLHMFMAVRQDARITNARDVCIVKEVRDKPLLMFDLNGTLVHRYSNGKMKHIVPRPGIADLSRLQDRFQLGIYSCATKNNVYPMVRQIEEAVGEKLFCMVLHRGHCKDASEDVCHNIGKWYAKQKPLYDQFGRRDVLLIDDERYKCLPKERDRLIWVPTWNTSREDDQTLPTLVNALLRYVHDDEDIRRAVPRINRSVRKYKREHLNLESK